MPQTEDALSTLYRGDTRLITVIVVDGSGDPIDITNDTITLTVAEYRQSPTPLTKVNGVGDHSDPANGVTVFTIDPADSASLSVRNYHIDVSRLVDSDSSVQTLFLGTIRVENKVVVVV